MSLKTKLILQIFVAGSLIGLWSCDDRSDGTISATPPGTGVVGQNSVSPLKVEAALDAAETYLRARDYASAELILSKLVERVGRNVDARELYGRLLLHLALDDQNVQQSEEQRSREELLNLSWQQYQQAVNLAPDRTELQQAAGSVAAMAGRQVEALRHYQAAARLDPLNPQPPLFAAQMQLQQGLLDEAQRSSQRVLELSPDEPMALATLAAIAMQRNDHQVAMRRIEAALSADPKSWQIRVQAAKIYRQTSQLERALELLLPLADSTRAEEAVTFEIATCYELLGQPLNSAEAWAHRHRLMPGDWLAAVRAGEAHLAAGDRRRAYQWYRIARLNAPSDGDFGLLGVEFGENNGGATLETTP